MKTAAHLVPTVYGIAFIALTIAGCAVKVQGQPGDQRFILRPTRIANHRIGVIKVGGGVACYFDGHVPAPSYAVGDIGRRGIPTPNYSNLKTIRLIQRYVRIRTLRFTYADGEFVVFNAPIPPTQMCHPDTPQFAMWNGACNEYYNPLLGETAAEPDCWHPPRPWMERDLGTGKGSWANIVH